MIFEAKSLLKRFGGITATNRVSFQVQENELVSVIGPNGAGKTTLFNLLTGHIVPDSGKVFFKGKDITGVAPHAISRMGIGRSFQRINIFSKLSTFQNIQVAILSAQHKSHLFFSSSRNMAVHETEEILQSVGLLEKSSTKGGLLSHGDQKRLEMGIALATRPSLLLLDEPTQGMSPQETNEMTELIKSLVKDKGLALIFVEHDMKVVFGISDKIIVLHQGAVIFSGTPASVRSNEDVQRIYLGEGSN
ncbi:ABC transporter ATP-binding protein [Desulfatitalea tepidiphila]|uniref:ABC transporter ATP-binding protein n=1 Tax=Desulfatitalea tepidiphila TaxID=1185843 RepID=UPI0009786CEE|nr:ABC transporter ATP-binding protein [Desulfatitalea tepidiphila]